MDMVEAIRQRHSVRRFTDRPLDETAVRALQEEIDACNRESGLRIQLVLNEPEAFQANKPSYGQFGGCRNYLAIIGPKGKDEEAGYYGERIVLKAQTLGIQSCWVALTYQKGKTQGTLNAGEKRYLVVALGYGETSGVSHKGKAITDVSDYHEGDPAWYRDGLEAALLAPTAINQQKFRFERKDDKVVARVSGFGFYTKIDLGIVKWHFEIGSGKGPEIFNI
ncbi:MAG: nitroreductase [Clostridia bacterium]|nr:nitroreductase [Clostridia bacterium]